jgi:NADH:ubiquinone oxidoreductase subunit F (NADH-binding)
MVDASICGLGQAAPNPIRMVMKHFADEVSDSRQRIRDIGDMIKFTLNGRNR